MHTKRIKLADAARRACVHQDTIRRWIRAGLLRASKVGLGGRWYVEEASLESVMSGERKPASSISNSYSAALSALCCTGGTNGSAGKAHV